VLATTGITNLAGVAKEKTVIKIYPRFGNPCAQTDKSEIRNNLLQKILADQ
jgi:hypothetical protein